MTEHMQTPDWAGELLQKASSLHQVTKLEGSTFKHFTVDDSYTTFFAEFELRDQNLIIHLFPRNGVEDVFFEGQYINRCKACRSEVPPIRPGQLLPCERCGKTARIYVPGRLEQRVQGLTFKDGTERAIRQAVNEVWLGDAAMDYVDELAAYAVRFDRAGTVASGNGQGLLDRFLEKVDHYIDQLP